MVDREKAAPAAQSNIKTYITRSSGDFVMDLPITFPADMQILVGKGSFVQAKKVLELKDDELVELKTQPVRQFLNVYLVQDANDESVHVLFDSYLDDRKDTPYDFGSPRTRYQRLALILSAEIFANKTLKDSKVTIFKVQAAPNPPAPKAEPTPVPADAAKAQGEAKPGTARKVEAAT